MLYFFPDSESYEMYRKLTKSDALELLRSVKNEHLLTLISVYKQ